MSLTLQSVQEEYKKNRELKPEDVKQLMDWIDKQPHLPKISELETIIFLHSCYYSLEAAKYTIDNFYTVRTHCPEFFTNRDPNGAMGKDMEVGLYASLPDLTPNGHRVIFCRLIDVDPAKWGFNEMLRLFTAVIDIGLMKHGTTLGHEIVFDMEGISFGHLSKLGLMPMKKYMYYLQEAMPVRLKGLHYINVVPFMDKILAIMKPFMKKELLEILYLHTDGLDSLYKFVPKKGLPKDIGGSGPSYSELHDSMKKEIIYAADYFREEEKLRVDETKRPGKAKNVGELFGVEGTFKKLDID